MLTFCTNWWKWKWINCVFFNIICCNKSLQLSWFPEEAYFDLCLIKTTSFQVPGGNSYYTETDLPRTRYVKWVSRSGFLDLCLTSISTLDTSATCSFIITGNCICILLDVDPWYVFCVYKKGRIMYYQLCCRLPSNSGQELSPWPRPEHSPIRLPHDFDPLAALDHLESLYGFSVKTMQCLPPSSTQQVGFMRSLELFGRNSHTRFLRQLGYLIGFVFRFPLP